jgi:hypothetical protein
MNPGRGQQIYDLFEQALRLSPDQRAAWLSARCGGDDDLRGAVQRLLTDDERASRDRFLTAPDRPGAAASRPEAIDGDTVDLDALETETDRAFLAP